MGKINVAIFPCTSTNALGIRNSLRDHVNFEIMGFSSKDREEPEKYYHNYSSTLPSIDVGESRDKFVEEFNRHLDCMGIDVLIPTHDDVVLQLSRIENYITGRVAMSSLFTCEVARNKHKTYKLFAGYDFCPRVYTGKLPSEFWVKPAIDQGGRGGRLVNSTSVGTSPTVSEIMNCETVYVFMEYLQGPEYTVDCFTDGNGELRFVGARERVFTINGISTEAYLLHPDSRIQKRCEEIAELINEKLNFRGMWFFQVKERELLSDCDLALLEVSARASGGVGFWRNVGINLSAATVYDRLDREIRFLDQRRTVPCLNLQRRYVTTCNNFDQIEFDIAWIDMDDTLLLKGTGQPNPKVMSLIYQLRNSGKRVCLITRRNAMTQSDIHDLFYNLGIHSNLFNGIHIVSTGKSKSSVIGVTANPILIDNSFYERLEVYNALGIPVFDIDSINCLSDPRDI